MMQMGVGRVKQHGEIPFIRTSVRRRAPGFGYSDTCWSTGNTRRNVVQKLADSARLSAFKIHFRRCFYLTKRKIMASCNFQGVSNKRVRSGIDQEPMDVNLPTKL